MDTVRSVAGNTPTHTFASIKKIGNTLHLITLKSLMLRVIQFPPALFIFSVIFDSLVWKFWSPQIISPSGTGAECI